MPKTTKPIESKQWLSCTKDYKKIRAYLDELTGKLSAEQKTDSLKAERDKLIAEVAELEKEKYYFAARMLDKYSEYACPPDTCGKYRERSGYCDGDNSDCTRCWLKFLMKDEK